ncbi:MAG: hypothetical protein IJ740_17100 [Ruminococcus sp.]|nr:hypothetical protein [Ruminococcus sp.]
MYKTFDIEWNELFSQAILVLAILTPVFLFIITIAIVSINNHFKKTERHLEGIKTCLEIMAQQQSTAARQSAAAAAQRPVMPSAASVQDTARMAAFMRPTAGEPWQCKRCGSRNSAVYDKCMSCGGERI